jgi:hypothetical protein
MGRLEMGRSLKLVVFQLEGGGRQATNPVRCHISHTIQQMGRRNPSEEATFTDNSKSARKAKSSEPATYRLAPHSKSRVAYFHDEGVGNYHYGVRDLLESCAGF